MVLAQWTVWSDFELSDDRLICGELQLCDLDARFVTDDFFRVLQAFACEGDFCFGATLSACGIKGGEMRRNSNGRRERQENE